RSNIDPRLLKIEMELNSIEAIKNAVQSGLGAAFISVSAIEKELKLGVLKRVMVENVVVKRTLSLILNPNRYRSKASEIFIAEILPKLSTMNANLEFLNPLAPDIPPEVAASSARSIS
ncbi:MAG: LysR family transcriptional regulator, partial [Acaryochloridaceae cyanobacterium RU_4_10]|nr:LysR family transcriptional regulator [Acaryochloridaceae cyanobacterium RU_4_10]